MRWLRRSVVLCVLMVALTPAPAHAWFEWLDYLSGPGPFRGWKVDVRVLCLGKPTPYIELRRLLETGFTAAIEGRERGARAALLNNWEAVINGLEANDVGLGLFEPSRFRDLRTSMRMLFSRASPEVRADELVAQRDVLEGMLNVAERTSVSIASSGIFVSLCSAEKRRAFAIEMGFTTLQADSNPSYANDHTIRLNTLTSGISYRLPFKADRDVVDVGFNAGMYRFSSRGFETFSGFTLEPFVDVHAPTELVAEKGLRQLAGLVTLRLGVVFFPAGFDGTQFASAPSKPSRISGSEGSLSATVFFDLAPLFRARP